MSAQSSRFIFISGFVIGLVTAGLFFIGFFEPFETAIYDYRMNSTEREELHGSLVMIGVDGPTDPASIAPLVQTLVRRGAQTIAVNEPVTGTPEAIEALIRAAGNNPRLLISVKFPEQDFKMIERGRIPKSAGDGTQLIGEDPVLARTALAAAYNNRVASKDGVLRRFTPAIGQRSEIGVALGSAAINTTVGLPGITAALGDESKLGVPPRLLIPFVRSASRLAFTPEDVTAGRVAVRGKTVLIGRTDDPVWQTPVGEMSDAEVTMQIASALIQGKGVTRAPPWVVSIALLTVCAALTMGGAPRHPLVDLALPLGVGAGIWILGGFAIDSQTWIDSVPLFFALTAEMIVVPILRGTAPLLFGGRGERRLENEQRYYETLLELMLQGGFAHSGVIWTIGDDVPVVLAMRGEVPAHLVEASDRLGVSESNRDEGQVLTLPLMTRGSVRGGIVLIRRRGPTLAGPRRALLERVASTFAATHGRGDSLYEALVATAEILDEQHRYPPGHAEAIARLALRIGAAAPLSATQVEGLRPAAYLHDIGMIGVPDAVLDTTERLTDQEYLLVKQHPLISRKILEVADFPSDVLAAVGAHHERWDGNGYPRELTGEDIPYQARILALADATISMMSDRPYRRGLSLDAAMEEIAYQRSRMFDPLLVETAAELAAHDPDTFKVPTQDRNSVTG